MLNLILSIVILLIAGGLVISEARTKKASDLVSNIFITVLLAGVSIYNMIQLGFNIPDYGLPTCIIYVGVLALAIAYAVLFGLHYLKYKKSAPVVSEYDEADSSENTKEDSQE